MNVPFRKAVLGIFALSTLFAAAAAAQDPPLIKDGPPSASQEVSAPAPATAKGVAYNPVTGEEYGKWRQDEANSNKFGYELRFELSNDTLMIVTPAESTATGVMFTFKRYRYLAEDPENKTFWIPLTSGKMFLKSANGVGSSGHFVVLTNHRAQGSQSQAVAEPSWKPIALRVQ